MLSNTMSTTVSESFRFSSAARATSSTKFALVMIRSSHGFCPLARWPPLLGAGVAHFPDSRLAFRRLSLPAGSLISVRFSGCWRTVGRGSYPERRFRNLRTRGRQFRFRLLCRSRCLRAFRTVALHLERALRLHDLGLRGGLRFRLAFGGRGARR